MAKVPDAEADLIYHGDWLSIRAMRRKNGTRPAKEWADNLQNKGKGQLQAAAAVMENSLQAGRPPAGRAEFISASTVGLWELRVTMPSSTPPHLRMFFLRRGRTLWATHGFTKTKNKLPQSEISKGDTIALEWLEREEDSK